MKKNVASQKVGAQMVSATDGSAFTGAVTVYVTGDAGTQAIGSVGGGACTHEGNGYHTYAPAQAETNYDLIAFTFIGTNAVPGTVQIYTSFPQTGDGYAEATNGTYGLSAIKGYVDDIGVAGAGLTALGDTRIANLDAAVSSRMATYTQPTGFLAATFPSGTVANTTNITAGTITTATNLTTNNDKTGYALTAAYDLAKTAAQAGDAMALTSGERTTLTAVIWNALTSGMTTVGSIGKKLADWVVGTIDTYTGNTKQTGDNYARLGAPAGASVSADIAAVKVDTAAILVDTGTTLDARIPAALVGGRMDSSVGAMAAGVVTAAAVATDAIDADALAADAVAEIQSGLSTLTQANIRTAVGLASANLDTQLSTIDDFLDTEIAAIKAQTDLIPAAPASTTNITAGTITTVTNLTNAPTAGDLTTAMKASVNAEVLDVINVDTYAEPGQEAPGATVSLAKKISYLYKLMRNKITQTSSTLKVYADDTTTVDQKATVSDDGTTYTRGEIGTGP